MRVERGGQNRVTCLLEAQGALPGGRFTSKEKGALHDSKVLNL